MLKPNSELRAVARTSLTGNWLMAALATLVYVVVAGGVGYIPVVGFLVSIAVACPLVYGLNVLFLDTVREGKSVEIGKMFDGFYDFGRIWGTMFLMNVYIWLWTLLLIVPGIVKGYSYAMTPYILKDEPNLKFNAAIEKSMKMMSGYKMKLFLLDLSFIGWGLLSLLTLGIGFLFLAPYAQSARAAFYEDLKNEQEAVDAEIKKEEAEA